MIDDGSKPPSDLRAEALTSDGRLNAKRVTFVYSMSYSLGDFVVIGGLLKKFDLLGVEFESLVAHRDSPHVSSFDGETKERFFNISRLEELISLISRLRKEKREGRLIFGLPMVPGSIQAFGFFWILKKLGALTYIVDFNLINADILTPIRRRYAFDRHLAQAAEILKRPDWLEISEMPLAIAQTSVTRNKTAQRIGFFPWSSRGWLPEFQWPEPRWTELTKLILRTSGTEIVLLGKDEKFARFEQTLRSNLPGEMQVRVISDRAMSVESLLASLQGIDCLITLNTSALHLAHALKLPTVALCGSTADFWLPEGEHIRIVRDTNGVLPPSDQSVHDPLQPSLQRIEVAPVFSAFEDLCRQFGIKPR
jgi:ADP-heptose:LPS heptosyltransferase